MQVPRGVSREPRGRRVVGLMRNQEAVDTHALPKGAAGFKLQSFIML